MPLSFCGKIAGNGKGQYEIAIPLNLLHQDAPAGQKLPVGITSADISAPPAYTQVLGMNERGRIALRRAAKAAAIPILTKPADAREFCGAVARQVALAQRGDLIYPLAMPVPMAGNAFILASPYCKK